MNDVHDFGAEVLSDVGRKKDGNEGIKNEEEAKLQSQPKSGLPYLEKSKIVLPSLISIS